MPAPPISLRFTMLWPCLFMIFSLLANVAAQSSNSSSNASSTSLSTFLSQTTTFATISTTIRSGNQNVPLATVVPIVLNVTLTATPTTPTASAAANTSTTSASVTPTPDPYRLETKIDPAFGVLGAILIITGLPSAFLGHKNRWTSFFLIGFYTLSLVCLALILKFGVLQAINPPNKTLRGLFVLACGVAGIAGGGITIFFWKVARYFIGAWGGFAFALWIQCFRNGGLIGPIGFRWIMYTGCAVVGFILCTIPKLHYYTILLSTAAVGATSFMLGVDCYTTADLKEFYIWNLGFTTLFQKYTTNDIKFPVSQTMQIELGLMGAVALMGAAVQFRVLGVLQRKLKEIREEQKRQDEAVEARAAERLASLEQEKAEWEVAHPGLAKHGRNDSAFTGTTLMKDAEIGTPDEKRASVFTLVGSPRQRYQSGISEFMAAPTPSDELNRVASRQLQSPGALPTLDLGGEIETDVPQTFLAESSDSKRMKDTKGLTVEELEDLKNKEELLAEIQTIRRSIDLLKFETPDPSSSSESRRPSVTSHRTLSHDLHSFSAAPSHLRPPREADPRGRAQSMEFSRLVDTGSAISRPTSTPLRDTDWDAYVRDRKLFQPPSGLTAPIPTTPVAPVPRMAVAPAVTEALLQRQRRESSMSFGQFSPLAEGGASPSHRDSPRVSAEGYPVAPRPQHQKSHSHGSIIPPVILPPRKQVASPAPETPRTMTYEELAERHREKMRELQAPLTQAETEQAKVVEAKNRWERAKEAEKQAVTKRQAEQAAALTKEAKKKRKAGEASDPAGLAGSVTPTQEAQGSKHSRSLSADILAAVPGAGTSSRRMSTMKVESWQKHQMEDVEMGLKRPKAVEYDYPGSSSKRRSGVPFPDSGNQSRDRRRTSIRDPPS